MLLNEYQRNARSTAIYTAKISYPTLGLAGETAELFDKIVNGPQCPDQLETDLILDEVGDVLWYVANLTTDLDTNLSYIWTGQVGHDNASCDDVVSSQIVIGPHEHLVVRVGQVAEQVKKMLRDSSGVLSDERRDNICASLRSILVLLSLIATRYRASLARVAKRNVEKLADRQRRGVIKGNGDNR